MEAVVVTLQDIIKERMSGRMDLAEFVDAVWEFAEDTGNEALMDAVDAFDAAAETDVEAAEETFEKTVKQIVGGFVAEVIPFDAITDGYPGAWTPAMIATQIPVSKSDFKTGLTYQVPRPIGVVNVGTAQAPVWEQRYEMISETVQEATASADFRKFKNAMKIGAYLTDQQITQWNLTVLTPSANYVATLGFTSPKALTVDWGDGTVDTITDPAATSKQHTYATAGTYTIKLGGTLLAGGLIKPGYDGTNDNLSPIITGTSKIISGLTILSQVFRKCTQLTTIPAGLFDGCPNVINIGGGFRQCSNLLAIPADLFKYNTAIASSNLTNCFDSCSKLTAIPPHLFDTLPYLTNMQSIFYNCSLITSIPPDLLKYNTAATSFQSMFQGTAITSIPTDLFRYNTQVTNFANTFNGCTGLTSIPVDLFRYNTAATNFTGTFQGCTALTSIPADLFKYNTAVTYFGNVFYGCTGLTSIPPDLFKYNTAATTFQSVFYNCTGLTSIPSGLFNNCINVTNLSGVFNNCSGITGSIPADLFKYNTQVTTFASTFYGSKVSGAIPAHLFDNCPLVTTFIYCFRGTNITSIPPNLFDFNTAATIFTSVFHLVATLTAIPTDLFKYNTAATDFGSAFNGCTSLTAIPAGLFSTNVNVTGFNGTFSACTGITAALPTGFFDNNTKVTDFTNTFNSCRFTTIPQGLFANCNKVTTYNQTFYGCTNLASALDVNFFNLTAPVTNFGGTFRLCGNITGTAPTIWVTYPSATSSLCFNGCTKLSNYASIPSAWK